MRCFLGGILIGFAIMGIATYTLPRHITGVNNELVSAGLARYDSKTGKCIWNDRWKHYVTWTTN